MNKFVLPHYLNAGGYYYYFYFKDLYVERTAVIKDFSTKKLFAKVIGRRDNTSQRYSGRFSEQVALTGTSLRNRGSGSRTSSLSGIRRTSKDTRRGY